MYVFQSTPQRWIQDIHRLVHQVNAEVKVKILSSALAENVEHLLFIFDEGKRVLQVAAKNGKPSDLTYLSQYVKDILISEPLGRYQVSNEAVLGRAHWHPAMKRPKKVYYCGVCGCQMERTRPFWTQTVYSDELVQVTRTYGSNTVGVIYFHEVCAKVQFRFPTTVADGYNKPLINIEEADKLATQDDENLWG